MKYALVNGQRHEAEKGLPGQCPSCDHPMLARCGKIKVKHWAHKGRRTCDPWWENETEWHRSWKGLFPIDWQERVHYANTGEKHIADVKTDLGHVIEFQHSLLKAEERRARGAFYEKLIWVVNGNRLKRDKKKFAELLNKAVRIDPKVPVLKLSGYLDECALLRDWAGNHAPVFFDFGDENVWYLIPGSTVNLAYVINLPRSYFVELHRGGEQRNLELAFWYDQIIKLVTASATILQAQSQARTQLEQLLLQRVPARRPRPDLGGKSLSGNSSMVFVDYAAVA